MVGWLPGGIPLPLSQRGICSQVEARRLFTWVEVRCSLRWKWELLAFLSIWIAWYLWREEHVDDIIYQPRALGVGPPVTSGERRDRLSGQYPASSSGARALAAPPSERLALGFRQYLLATRAASSTQNSSTASGVRSFARVLGHRSQTQTRESGPLPELILPAGDGKEKRISPAGNMSRK
jgi:hypothetical protein